MNPLTALGGGLAGACAVTLIHETVRRIVPEAPRLDLLGMTAIEKGLRAAGKKAPGENQLFTWALAGDIVSNSLYFSLAGVWGWTNGRYGRGDANSVVFDKSKIDIDLPIPNGMVWNMKYDAEPRHGVVSPVDRKEMWLRLKYFLDNILPVAEEAGVRLVAHPDDPPLATMRGTARLFYTPEEYEQLLTIHSSPANGFEFCLGTIQEMQNSDVYAMLDTYSRTGKIGYIHFRNVVGRVPHYREAFVDEGDINMIRCLKILQKNQYQGVLIPDHTPEMSCNAPWHAGMAYALGYMKGVMQTLNDHDG